MKAVLTAILGAGLAATLWAGDESRHPPGKRTMPEGLFFSTIALSNDCIVATMPETQIRYRCILNGTSSGFADPRQVFVLRSGDTLKLAEKHHTVTATPIITETNAEITVTQVFDARSFGDSVSTNVGIVKLK